MNGVCELAIASRTDARRVGGPGGDVPRPRFPAGRGVIPALCRRIERRDAEMTAAWEDYKADRTPERLHRYQVTLRLRGQLGEVLAEVMAGRRPR
jgi:hypothetical protein